MCLSLLQTSEHPNSLIRMKVQMGNLCEDPMKDEQEALTLVYTTRIESLTEALLGLCPLSFLFSLLKCKTAEVRKTPSIVLSW